MLDYFFQIDESGKSFKKINRLEFNKWLHGKGKHKGGGSNFSKEQIALANGFMKVVNASKTVIVKFDDTYNGGVLDPVNNNIAIATIGKTNTESYSSTGIPIKANQTSLFVHEVVGEGLAFFQYGNQEYDVMEAREKYGSNGETLYFHPGLRARFLQIIQTENLYWKIQGINSLRTGVKHSVSPSDINKVGLIPENLKSSFYETPSIIQR